MTRWSTLRLLRTASAAGPPCTPRQPGSGAPLPAACGSVGATDAAAVPPAAGRAAARASATRAAASPRTLAATAADAAAARTAARALSSASARERKGAVDRYVPSSPLWSACPPGRHCDATSSRERVGTTTAASASASSAAEECGGAGRRLELAGVTTGGSGGGRGAGEPSPRPQPPNDSRPESSAEGGGCGVGVDSRAARQSRCTSSGTAAESCTCRTRAALWPLPCVASAICDHTASRSAERVSAPRPLRQVVMSRPGAARCMARWSARSARNRSCSATVRSESARTACCSSATSPPALVVDVAAWASAAACRGSVLSRSSDCWARSTMVATTCAS